MRKIPSRKNVHYRHYPPAGIFKKGNFMKQLSIKILANFLLLLCVAFWCDAETITGSVQNRRNNPIPGLTVSLVHPKVGRSTPSVTNEAGQYFIPNIPAIRDAFYLEIYWGHQLLYRKPIRIKGNVKFNPITLNQ
jgi:hypothetical protein